MKQKPSGAPVPVHIEVGRVHVDVLKTMAIKLQFFGNRRGPHHGVIAVANVDLCSTKRVIGPRTSAECFPRLQHHGLHARSLQIGRTDQSVMTSTNNDCSGIHTVDGVTSYGGSCADASFLRTATIDDTSERTTITTRMTTSDVGTFRILANT